MFKFLVILLMALGLFYLIFYPPMYYCRYRICKNNRNLISNQRYCANLSLAILTGVLLFGIGVTMHRVLAVPQSYV